MKKTTQLYTVHKDVWTPHFVKPRTRDCDAAVKHRSIPKLPIVHWPNGKPCIAVNSWLNERVIGTTGSSITTYASQITHIVRYCAQEKIAFESLSDSAIHDFSAYLVAEQAPNNPAEKRRNNNQSREIIGLTLRFLVWYQKHLVLPTDQKLIGKIEESPKIIVKEKRNPHSKKIYLFHSSLPPKVATDIKTPIPDHIISDIEDQIELRSDVAMLGERAKRRYIDREDFLIASMKYVRARRVFTLWMMKRTGLRPEELHEIPLNDNRDVLNSKCIIIPTKKRRKHNAPMRSFRIEGADARKFNRYLRSRNEFVAFLESDNVEYHAPNQILLGREGEAVRKESVRKDFDRLVNDAGYADVKTCLSMFRHRFITREVIIYFREFMASTNKTRAMITDADYRSILKRIATKTGHGSEESLWHYIDLAWDEMGVWGDAEKGIQQLHAADRFREELLELKHSIKNCQKLTVEQMLDHVTKNLRELIADAKEYIEPNC